MRRSRYHLATLIAFALVFLAPLYVVVIASLKPLDEIRAGGILALPVAPSLAAWSKAWSAACVGASCVVSVIQLGCRGLSHHRNQQPTNETFGAPVEQGLPSEL